MSYFLIPKINNIIVVNPKLEEYTGDYEIQLSHSLFNFHDTLHRKIINTCIAVDNENTSIISDISDNTTYENIVQCVNPHEYIFSTVPGSKLSVSKLNTKTSLFYDFLEVSISLNIFDVYKYNKSINVLHITPNHSDSVECYELLRENFCDNVAKYDEINEETTTSIGDNKYDFIFLEIKTTTKIKITPYIYSFIENIMVILRNQKIEGNAVIKINHIFHKQITDILFILSSLYEKVYILKPNSSNITTFEKYIICKKFQSNENNCKIHKLNYFKLSSVLKNSTNKQINTILDYEIPYYFTMKLNDINMIIGQQQLESLNTILNLLKNKNKEDRYDIMKKTNIHKAVMWCEKYKIPCNKFNDKINIFLPINTEGD